VRAVSQDIRRVLRDRGRVASVEPRWLRTKARA